MTVIYTSNDPTIGFDALSAGTVPTKWTALTGAWVLTTTDALAGHTHAFGIPGGGTDGSLAVLDGVAAQTDVDITFGQNVADFNSGPSISNMAPFFRGDATLNNGYLYILAANSPRGTF